MKRILCSLLLLLGALAARASTSVISVDNIAALIALPTNGTPVDVLGYYAPNDGGGGLFALTNSTSGTNYGTMFQSSVTGWSWQRILGSTVDIRHFGASTNAADNLKYITNAVAFAERQSLDVLVPIGQWTNSGTITLTRSWLHGIKTEQARSTGTNQSVLVFNLDPNTSTEGVRMTATGPDTGQPRLSDLWLVSTNRSNARTKQAITGVASRLQFTVNSNSAPTLPDTGGTNIYPYAGLAFFFTPGTNYLGSAVISSFSTAGSTTTINLHPDYDWFATPSNNMRMLTTNCTVVFAPVTTCADGVLRVDPSLVGPAGVRVAGGSPLGLTIDNVGTFNFWTGCTFANAGTTATYVPRMGDFTSMHSVWSGVGKDVRGGGTGAYDWYQTGFLDIDGYGGTFDIDVDEREYARCAFGLFCPPNSSELDTILTDGCLNGLMQYATSGTKITKAFFDNTGLNGLIWQYGVDTNTANAWLSIGQLAIQRTLGGVSYSIQRTNKYGIWMNLNPSASYFARLNLGSLNWGTIATTNNPFDAAFNLQGGNPCVTIGALTPDHGHAYATMLAPGSVAPFLVNNQSGSTALPGFVFDQTGTAPVWNAGTSTVINAPKVGIGDFSATPAGVFNAPVQIRLPYGLHLKVASNYLAGTTVATIRMSASDESFTPQPFKFQALSHNFTVDSDTSYVLVLTNNTATVNGATTLNGAATVNGATTLNSTATVNGTTTVNGAASVIGNFTARPATGKNLTVTSGTGVDVSAVDNAGTTYVPLKLKASAVTLNDGTRDLLATTRNTGASMDYQIHGTGSTPTLSWTDAGLIGWGDYTGVASTLNTPFQWRMSGMHLKLTTNNLAGTSVPTVRLSSSDDSFGSRPFKFQALSHHFTTDSDSTYVLVLTNNTATVNGPLTVNGTLAASGHVLAGTTTDNGSGNPVQALLSGANGAFDLTVYGGAAGTTYRAASGTLGSPGATTSGQIVRPLLAYGTTNGTDWAIGSRIEAVPTRTWDASGYGMRLGFHVTPNAVVGSTVEALRIDQDSSVQALGGDVKINTAGKGLVVKSGTNSKLDATGALTAGTKVVNNTSVTANSRIFFTLKTLGGTVGMAPYVSAITAGTSFTVTAGAGDTSDYYYFIVEAQ